MTIYDSQKNQLYTTDGTPITPKPAKEGQWLCDHCGTSYDPYSIGTYQRGPKRGRRIMSHICKSCRTDEEN